MKKTVLVLFGGCSSEYEVSLQSAHGVLAHWSVEKYGLLTVGITREGRWLYYAGGAARLAAGDWQTDGSCVPCALQLDRGHGTLLLLDGSGRTLPFDAAFPVFHGRNGEDGTIQGALELAGVPVVGCGVLSSALCMDKDRAHALAGLTGVRTPKSAVFSAAGPAIAETAEALGFPLFVKPLRAGSSFGISRVESPKALDAAVEEAFRYDSQVILEEAVPGFEVGCAVLGNPGRGQLTVGAVDEIELSGGVFSFDEKYTLKTAAIHCPARIPAETAVRVQAAARAVYAALDCRVFARVDFFLTPAGEIVFNEVNTIPGLTAHSRFPSMMQAVGWDFSTLLERLLELGVEP